MNVHHQVNQQYVDSAPQQPDKHGTFFFNGTPKLVQRERLTLEAIVIRTECQTRGLT